MKRRETQTSKGGSAAYTGNPFKVMDIRAKNEFVDEMLGHTRKQTIELSKEEALKLTRPISIELKEFKQQ